ncbi:MAG TPA: sigma-70 family RNA polymerase sigma factor [Ktedonobacteraceae bacterium]|nr:sigma-70 family RNA polymerase sigma factor [Ktedonobacteraceae bacterium]
MVFSQLQDVPLSAVEQYLRGVKLAAPLLDEEEAMLLRCIERGKSEQVKRYPDGCVLRSAEQARDRLIEGYQPLLIGLARRYVAHCREMELLDLVQEGNVGLLQALEKFDDCAGSGSFRTWAFSWVRGMMLLALWQYEGALRLPLEKARAVRNMEMANTRLLASLGREPTIEETAQEMCASEKDVRDLIVLREQAVVSLHAFPDDEDCSLEETIVDPRTLEDADEDLHDLLMDALVLLPERERLIVNLRYGFEDGQARTQREVAYLLGVSTTRVAELDRRAQRRLRQLMRVA